MRRGLAIGSRSRQDGISLIEVMVALLLLAVGLLGMLGLKAAGLKHTGNANSRAVASIHATDMLDRVRANPVRAVAGQYAIGLADATPTAPVGVAQTDLAQWRARLADNLPGGTGSVLVQADGLVRVVVQWTERTQDAEPQTVSFTFESRL